MELVTSRSGGIVVAQACKRVDSTNARAFEQALKGIVTEDDQGMVVDCEDLAYISSAGLRAVLLTAKTLARRQSGFAMCCLGNSIREVFAISGFDKIIAIHPTQDAAVAALAR